ILALDTEADAASLHALIEKENEGKAHFGLGLAFIGPWLAGDAPAVHKPIAGLLGELGAAHPKASPGRQHFEPEDGVIERLSLLGELLDDSGIHVRILEPGIQVDVAFDDPADRLPPFFLAPVALLIHDLPR